MGKLRQTSLLEHDRSGATSLRESIALVCESVDAENGVIRGVKVIGLESRNGRRYLAEALQKARPLYEDVRVNLNHPKNPNEPRDYRDRFGLLRNVTFSPDGLRGDLHYNPKHPLAEQFVWDAKNAPGNLGLSHNAVGHTTTDRAGDTVVDEITRLLSVDLVADPATTKSLFESEGNVADDMKPEDEVKPVTEMDGDPEEMPTPEEDAPTTVEPSLQEIADAFLGKLKLYAVEAAGDDGAAVGTAVEKIKEIKAILAELMGGASSEEVATEESLPAKGGKPSKTADANYVALQKQLKTLQEQVKESERKEAARLARIAKKASVMEAIRNAKLNPNDEKQVSKAFLESLMSAPDAKVKALVEDRAALLKGLPAASGQTPRSAPAGGARGSLTESLTATDPAARKAAWLRG